jgi:hypothetical protein
MSIFISCGCGCEGCVPRSSTHTHVLQLLKNQEIWRKYSVFRSLKVKGITSSVNYSNRSIITGWQFNQYQVNRMIRYDFLLVFLTIYFPYKLWMSNYKLESFFLLKMNDGKKTRLFSILYKNYKIKIINLSNHSMMIQDQFQSFHLNDFHQVNLNHHINVE